MQPTTRVKRDLSLRDILAMLRRQRGIIIIVFIICFAGAAAAFRITKATFRTNTAIYVDMHDAAAANGKGDPVSTALSPASDVPVSTQVQKIQDTGFIDQVFFEGHIGQYSPDAPNAPLIHAEQRGDTNVISIAAEASDPFTATKIAETVPKVYNDMIVAHRSANMTKGLEFLAARLKFYTDDYTAKIQAVQKFKSTRTLPALTGEDSQRSHRVSETQAAVTQAEASVAAAQERVDTLTHEKVLLPKEDSIADVKSNDSEIEAQKQLLIGLKSQRASLLTQWKEGTPKIKEIDAQIAEQQRRLDEIPPVVKNTDKSSRHPRELALESQIDDAKVGLASAKVQERKAQEAAGQAVVELKDYSALEPKQAQLAESAADAKSQMDNASKMLEELKLESVATVDSGATYGTVTTPIKIRPVLAQYVALAVIAGIVLGFGLALVKDHVEDRLSSPQDVFQICGLEPLAQMPALPALGAGNGTTALARHEANPALFDSYRLLRFNLLNAAERGYMGSLVVTSVTGSEGKSDLACDLAEVMAAGGRRIVLVDANLRNPSLAGHFSVAERPGLTDVLVGDAKLEDALYPTAIPGLSVLPAGAKTPNPVDLLESSQMVSLHNDLREHADLIIFDAPSCLSYADVSVLASFTDSVLVVAELGSTKRDLLDRGVQMLQRSSARLVGIVLRDKQLPKRTKRGKAAA